MGLSKILRIKAQRHFWRRQYLIGDQDESPPTYSLKKIFNIFLSTIYKTIIYLFKNSKNFGVQTVINFSLIDPYCLKTYSYLLMLIKYHIYFLSIYIYIYIYITSVVMALYCFLNLLGDGSSLLGTDVEEVSDCLKKF